jgi:hypothetical protein
MAENTQCTVNEQDFMEDLIKLQSEIHNPTNTAINPFLKSKYAPLNEILNMVRELCNKNNFFLSQDISGDGEFIKVQTSIVHKTGQAIKSNVLEIKPDKKGIQGAGAAITYMRRYQLLSLLGIAGEDDNDGENTEKEQVKSAPKSVKKSAPTKTKKTPKSAQTTPSVQPTYEELRKTCKPLDMILEEMDLTDEKLTDTTIIEAGSMMVGRHDLTPGDLKAVRKALQGA